MALPYLRHERVSELIREELGKIILRELEFGGALMTIVGVDVSKKIDYAKVRISVIPSERAEEALAILNRARGQLHHILLRKINIKPMPDLSFEIDHGLERAAHLEKTLLDEEKKGAA